MSSPRELPSAAAPSRKEPGHFGAKELQSILGTKFFLELYVKVLKNWLENPQIVRQLD